MSNFFDKEILKKIKENESDIKLIKNFISKEECLYFVDYFRNLKNKSVGKSQAIDREESTKIFFDFDQSNELKKLKKKIVDFVGEFYVNDFQPHFITSRYPLRLHVDTGKNPKDLIFKNIIIPVEIEYDNTVGTAKPPNTIIFKNKWYEQSSLFTEHAGKSNDFIIKDKNGNFVDILDIHDFKAEIEQIENKEIEYEGKQFFINSKFKSYIANLCKIKRYNLRTNKHIINDKEFNKEDYDKYLSHQPYEDCKSLEVDKIIEWEIGSLVFWDRTRIHCSDNFLINNVVSKSLIALFTSKKKI